MVELPKPERYDDYIKAGKTPFERLARKWECETWSLGLRQTADTPPEIAKRRWKEFWAVWESK